MIARSCAVGAALLLAAAPALAAPDPADLSGLWVVSNRSSRGDLDEKLQPLKGDDYLTAKGKASIAAVKPADDPSAKCLPSIPRQIPGPYPIEIVQRPGRVVMLFEWDTVFRIIYTDGRPHPDPEVDQRYMGHAIGTWDGKTLVVDTSNFNGKAWLEGRGLPMSEKAHVVDQMTLIEGGKTLEIVEKVEDPVYLARPVWRRYMFNLKPEWSINEYFCAEGNRDDASQQREGQPGSLEKSDVIKAR